MEIQELPEPMIRRIVADVLPPLYPRTHKQMSRVYLAVRFGEPERGIKPQMSIYALSKRLGYPTRTMTRWMRDARAAIDPIVQSMRAEILGPVVAPAESALYFGDTIAYGHEADTRIDYVEEAVVMGYGFDSLGRPLRK